MNGKPGPRGGATRDQVFPGSNEIIDTTLFPLLTSGFVPFLAIFAAAANIVEARMLRQIAAMPCVLH